MEDERLKNVDYSRAINLFTAFMNTLKKDANDWIPIVEKKIHNTAEGHQCFRAIVLNYASLAEMESALYDIENPLILDPFVQDPIQTLNPEFADLLKLVEHNDILVLLSCADVGNGIPMSQHQLFKVSA